MAEYTELKSLARALPAKSWHAAHANAGPRGWEVCQVVDQVAADLTGPRAKFIAAANPTAILALIAAAELTPNAQSLLIERDRLQAEVQRLECQVADLRSNRPANAWRVIDRKGKRFTIYHQGLAEAIAAEGLAVTPMCDTPPQGWECSREPGHTGPCAASEVQP